MNHIFKKVWNKALGRMVVVAENAKSAGKTKNDGNATVGSIATDVASQAPHYKCLLKPLLASLCLITGSEAWSGVVCDWTATSSSAQSTAAGVDSIACGLANTASGYWSSALGYSNTASGQSSSVLGYRNAASGYASSALGYRNTASGSNSSALGGGYWLFAFNYNR